MKTLGWVGRRRRTPISGGSFRITTPRASVLAIAMAAGGCQSYERRPLDEGAIREAWVARAPSDESARQFAARLAEAEGRSTDAFDPADGLTLTEAEPIAMVFNRRLRVARLQAGVTRATANTAGRWDDPVAGVDIERIVSGVADPWVVAGTIGLTIPISGRLAVEKERAGAAYAAELHRVAAKEWATRAALRELWIEWSAQAHRARLAGELAASLATIADLADRKERAGSISRIDARVFSVALASAQAEVITSHARQRELELQVRDILGISPEAPVQLIETLAFDVRDLDGASLDDAMSTGNAELAAVRAEYEVAEQSVRLEVRGQYPDLTIGPGYGTDQGDDRVLLGIQLPIPLWNRNLQGVMESLAAREVARGEFESTYEHLASQLAIAQTRYEAGRAARDAVETHLVPLADEQNADVHRVAELGRVDPLLLLQAIQAQHDAKVRLVDARAAEAIGAIRLDELIGPPAPVPAITPVEHTHVESQTPAPHSTGERP